MITRLRIALALLGQTCVAAAALAQTAKPVPSTIDGPPAPVAPATITRDTAGRATVRALKLTEPLRVDGRLDEAIYTSEQPFGGLIQVAPAYGAQATERSDVWVMFDASTIYVTCRCWDSAPPREWIVNELRRDTAGLRNNDHFGVMFDTFYDRRSGFAFYTNPLGARADYSVVDEGASNTDWNPVWDVKTGRFDGGWIVEMAIPFKSLRYRSGPDQMWGLQLRRSIRRKNEWVYLTPVPRILAGPQALNRVSAGGTLVGLDLPEARRNLEIKPYVIGSVTSDRLRVPPISNARDAAAGLDTKFGVNANLTADLTVNTDFAQVEVDEQQVNLTRFSLFYPEKRDFFLEGRGVFDFARGGSGVQPGPPNQVTDTPYLFYSRRIGLNGGRVVPIDVGGRLTGKAGAYAIGAMAIRTGDEAASASLPTTFGILRVKRDLFRRSAIGAMFTDRSAVSGGRNQAYGADAAFGLYQNVQLTAYAARTETPGRSRDATSLQGRFDYSADRYGAQVEYLKVGPDFNPEIGFLRRRDFRKSSATLRFSPRPVSMPSIRKFTYQVRGDYFENNAGVVESREQNGRFSVEFQSSDVLQIDVSNFFERLAQPLPIAGLVVSPGAYVYWDTRVAYMIGQQRRVSGTLSLRRGRLYGGDITAIEFSSARVVVSPHLSVEPSLLVNHLTLPAGSATQTLARARADYGFSSRMFASALLQFNSTDHTFSSNFRYRWEYRPGSEFFIVWTDEHGTDEIVPSLHNRAFVLKLTRLFR